MAMRSVYLAGAWVLTLVLALPVQAQKKPGKTPAQPLEAEKVLPPGNVTGRVTTLSGSLLTLRVEYNSLALAPNARTTLNKANRQNQQLINQFNRLGQLQNQAMQARNQQQYNRAMQQINTLVGQIQRTASRTQQGLYRVVKKTVDIEMEMAPDVTIRTNFLPLAYDDMGDPKKYTKEEIKELKGPNPKELGYKAELDALKVGQDVRVTLARIKDPLGSDDKEKPADKKAPADDKKTDPKDPKDTDAKTKPRTRLLATKVLILKESDQPESPGKGKGPKK